jgi:hypothetical protein
VCREQGRHGLGADIGINLGMVQQGGRLDRFGLKSPSAACVSIADEWLLQ